MKNFKTLINARFIIGMMMVASLLTFTVSCGGEEDEPAVPGTVSADVPDFAVVNVPVSLVDKSLSVASRAWTITNGTPASSTEKTLDVTFNTVGAQTVTLEVTFENGTVVSETYDVTVAAELNGTITATGGEYSFAFGDKELSYTFELAIEDEVGDADSYAWTFPAGSTPESSTEANPTVIFAVENPEISLTLSRSADGAELTITETLTTSGPANLFTSELWGFEGEGVSGMLQTWDGDASGGFAEGVVAIENGYEGKGMVVNYPGGKGYYGIISRDFKDHNAQLVQGDIVLFSYYSKVVSGTPTGFSRIVNHVPSWSVTDPALAQNYQFYNNLDFHTQGITSEWTKVSVIDTLDNLEQATAANVFPEIGFSSDGGAGAIAFDNVELRLLGNAND